MTGLIDFSIDPISNDLGAPPINFQEGQPAGTVNNSARALMAALACWRDDNVGVLGATRGAGDVYVLTSNQVFSADTADTTGTSSRAHTLAFTVDAANQGPVQLAPDGCPAKPVRRPLGRELAPGDLTPGIVYRVNYLPKLAAYVVVGPSFSRPGQIAIQADATPDAGWLACDGSAVSRAAYAALFTAIGVTYGGGDGSTTFNLPNFSGGRAPMGPGLTGVGGIGAALGSSGGVETVQLVAAQMPSHSHGGTAAAAGGHDHGGSVTAAGQHSHGGATGNGGGHTHGAATATAGAHQHTGTTNVGGSHGHAIPYAVGTAGSGSSNRVVTDLNPNGAGNAGGAVQSAGDHTHDFTTGAAGDHSHGVNVAPVGDHAHGIAGDGQHQHGIAAVGDHTHGLTITAAGSDQAHTNMPPGLVVAFVIKA